MTEYLLTYLLLFLIVIIFVFNSCLQLNVVLVVTAVSESFE